MSLMSVVLMLVAANANPAQIADRYAPGQVIVRLTDDCRGQVNPAINGELSTLGIPALDRLDAVMFTVVAGYFIWAAVVH